MSESYRRTLNPVSRKGIRYRSVSETERNPGQVRVRNGTGSGAGTPGGLPENSRDRPERASPSHSPPSIQDGLLQQRSPTGRADAVVRRQAGPRSHMDGLLQVMRLQQPVTEPVEQKRGRIQSDSPESTSRFARNNKISQEQNRFLVQQTGTPTNASRHSERAYQPTIPAAPPGPRFRMAGLRQGRPQREH